LQELPLWFLLGQDGDWEQTGRFPFFLTGDWGTFRLSPVFPRTVQQWLGHTDLQSALRYLKSNRAVVQEKVEAIWKTVSA
jgi:hypothetical protein